MKASRRIANEFRLEAIKIAVDLAIADILANRDDFYPDFMRGEVSLYMLDCFTPDSAGTYQTSEIKDLFSLRLALNEWAWERIEQVFSDVANILNRKLALEHENFDDLFLLFGHSDHSGDWGLQLAFSLK